MAKAVDAGEPKRLSSVGIDLVGLLDPPEIVCVLIFETDDGVYRFEVDRDRAEIIAEDMQRYFDVVGKVLPQRASITASAAR